MTIAMVRVIVPRHDPLQISAMDPLGGRIAHETARQDYAAQSAGEVRGIAKMPSSGCGRRRSDAMQVGQRVYDVPDSAGGCRR